MTLFVYLSRSFILRLLFVWLLFIFLVLIGDTIELSRSFGGKSDISYSSIFLLSLMRVPYFSQSILPFAVFFGALLSLYLLSRRLELVILRASGISVWQFLFPFCVISIFVGLFVALVYDPLSLRAYKHSKIYESELFLASNSEATIRNNTWIRLPRADGIGDTIIRSSISRSDGIHLTDTSFYLYSGSGKFEDRYDASIAIFSEDDNSTGYKLTNVTRITPDISPTKINSVFVPLGVTRQELQLRSFTPEETDFWHLQQRAQEAHNAGRNPLPFETRYFNLLSLPFLFLSMVLIASCVSLLFLRFGSYRWRIALGILSSFVLYIFGQLILTFGSNGLLPILWVAYFPSLLALLLSFSILLLQEDG